MRFAPHVRVIATTGYTLLLALGVIGCEGPTGVGASDARFDGDWSYVAEQAGSALTVEGTLTLDGAASGSLNGTLDAQQVSALGDRTPFPGLVAGVVTGTGVARIEISLPSGRRRTHLTQLRGDSLVGDWVESGASPASGTFRAARGTR
jgi:hypothetical protein